MGLARSSLYSHLAKIHKEFGPEAGHLTRAKRKIICPFLCARRVGIWWLSALLRKRESTGTNSVVCGLAKLRALA